MKRTQGQLDKLQLLETLLVLLGISDKVGGEEDETSAELLEEVVVRGVAAEQVGEHGVKLQGRLIVGAPEAREETAEGKERRLEDIAVVGPERHGFEDHIHVTRLWRLVRVEQEKEQEKEVSNLVDLAGAVDVAPACHEVVHEVLVLALHLALDNGNEDIDLDQVRKELGRKGERGRRTASQ